VDETAVVQAIRDAERAAAVGWRGAKAGDNPCVALRRLAAELRDSEGGSYELTASGLDRSAQILLLTLCGRYGLRALRRKGQRHNTVVLQGSETFLEKVLWPMFTKQLDAMVPAIDAWLHGVLSAALPEP
jgi:hypothetical protein